MTKVRTLLVAAMASGLWATTAFGFTPVGKSEEFPASEVSTRWQTMLPDYGESIWSACLPALQKGVSWPTCLNEFVEERNLDKFPKLIIEAEDTYLSLGVAYWVPVTESVKEQTPAPETVRLLADIESSIFNQVADLFIEKGLGGENVLANIQTALAGKLDRQAVVGTIQTALANQDGLSDQLISEISDALEERLTEFETRLVNDFEALRQEFAELRDEVRVIGEDLGAVKTKQNEHSDSLAALQSSVDTTAGVVEANAEVLNAVKTKQNEHSDSLAGLQSSVDKIVGEVPATKMHWSYWLTVLLVAIALSLLLTYFLWGRRVNEVEKIAKSAQSEAGRAINEIGPLKDRLKIVEAEVGLLMELDAQDRFNNPELTEAYFKNHRSYYKPLILRVKCQDGKFRHVHVTQGIGGDGKPQLEFLGLQKGLDFIGTVTLAALQGHLRNAVKQNWVIGVQQARAEA